MKLYSSLVIQLYCIFKSQKSDLKNMAKHQIMQSHRKEVMRVNLIQYIPGSVRVGNNQIIIQRNK